MHPYKLLQTQTYQLPLSRKIAQASIANHVQLYSCFTAIANLRSKVKKKGLLSIVFIMFLLAMS